MRMEKYKILLVTGNTIGDAVCFTPTIHALKKINPAVQLDMLVYNKAIGEMYAHDPAIDQVIISPKENEINKLQGKYDFCICYLISKSTFNFLSKLRLNVFLAHCYKQSLAEGGMDLIRQLFPEAQDLQVEKYYLYPQKSHDDQAKSLLNPYLTNDSVFIVCHLGYSGLAVNKKSWFERIVRRKYGQLN